MRQYKAGPESREAQVTELGNTGQVLCPKALATVLGLQKQLCLPALKLIHSIPLCI